MRRRLGRLSARVAAAVIVLFVGALPTAGAAPTLASFGLDSCPGVTFRYVQVSVFGNGQVRIRGFIEACASDNERTPVAVNETTPALVPLELRRIPSGIIVPRDADRDGVPTLAVERVTVIVHEDGRIEERDFVEEPTGLVDPDDGDPSNPMSPIDPHARASAGVGCERDAVCIAATLRGTPADRDVDARANAGPATDAVHGATGMRPVELTPNALAVRSSVPPVDAITPPMSSGVPEERVAVGSATARAACPSPAAVITPASGIEGIADRHVGSSELRELSLAATLRCVLLSLVANRVVPVGPVGAGTPWG